MRDGYFLSSRHIVMHPHLNSTNNLFGGQLLSFIDVGAGMYAQCQMRTDRVVTRYFGPVEFTRPIELGSIVHIYCKKIKEGETSLTVEEIVTKVSHDRKEEIDITKTEIVFVAVDENARKRKWNT